MQKEYRVGEKDLLPTKINPICVVCDESKHFTRFPLWPPTSGCTHKQTTCSSCLNDSIAYDIEHKGVKHINWPECGIGLSYDEVVRYANEQVRIRYEELLIRTALQDEDDFVWCSTSGCNGGQIHLGGEAQPIVKCNTCGNRTCFTHGIPWHTGFSCEEYDIVQSSRSGDIRASSSLSEESPLTAASLTTDLLRAIEDERASLSTIMSTTKPCPNCERNIEKNGGCAHMTCVSCQHEFCWQCGKSWSNRHPCLPPYPR